MKQHSLRHYFPAFATDAALSGAVYFDSAATSQKPQQVLDKVNYFYQQQNANVHRASHARAAQATQAFENARQAVADFIHAKASNEIVWTKGATEALNLVAHGLGKWQWGHKKTILVSACEHHANIVPWQQITAHTGLAIKVMPVDQRGVLDINVALSMIDSDTAIVAVGHVSNALGNIHPVQLLIDKANHCGAVSVIDGTQAVAHIAVDVQALNCDFYVFSGHKMFAPTGTGVLYGKYDMLAALPVYQTGGEMIRKVSFERSEFQPPPARFEAGTPNIAGVIGLAEAVSFIQQHRDTIQASENALYQRLMAGLAGITGIQLWGDTEQSICSQSFTVDGINNQDLGVLLNEQGFAVRVGHHCAMPLMQTLGLSGTVRASLSCYNTEDEVDSFIGALQSAIEHLKNQETANPGSRPGLGESESEDNPLPLANAVRQARGWDSVYRQIMLAGKGVNPLPASQRVSENEVYGCESQVWIAAEVSNGRMTMMFFSPSKIVRGLIAILLEPLQGKSVDQVSQFDASDYLQSLGLARHLSPSRGNGLRAVMDKVRLVADSHQ